MSRLKRLSLFRSCRREASSKTQGLSEDASHHEREHKTPTEGTAHGIYRSVSQNQRFRHSGFFTLSLKGCCLSAEKVFGSTPFSKGVAGCRAGSPAKSGVQGRKPCKERWVAGRGALQREPGAGWESCKERWVVERGPCKKYKNRGEQSTQNVSRNNSQDLERNFCYLLTVQIGFAIMPPDDGKGEG